MNDVLSPTLYESGRRFFMEKPLTWGSGRAVGKSLITQNFLSSVGYFCHHQIFLNVYLINNSMMVKFGFL